MRKVKPLKIFTIIVSILLSFSIVYAQDGNQFDKQTDKPANNRDLVRELNLTQEQVMQVRLLRRENTPLLRAALTRQRDARRNLDTAVYADAVDETEIRLYLKDLVEAQAEVTRLRFMNEMAVRKVLTPEQLEKFRNLRKRIRQQQMDRRQKNVKRRQNRRNQNNQP